MSKVIEIREPGGDKAIINEGDFDPKTHKLWSDPVPEPKPEPVPDPEPELEPEPEKTRRGYRRKTIDSE